MDLKSTLHKFSKYRVMWYYVTSCDVISLFMAKNCWKNADISKNEATKRFQILFLVKKDIRTFQRGVNDFFTISGSKVMPGQIVKFLGKKRLPLYGYIKLEKNVNCHNFGKNHPINFIFTGERYYERKDFCKILLKLGHLKSRDAMWRFFRFFSQNVLKKCWRQPKSCQMGS